MGRWELPLGEVSFELQHATVQQKCTQQNCYMREAKRRIQRSETSQMECNAAEMGADFFFFFTDVWDAVRCCCCFTARLSLNVTNQRRGER